MSAAMQNVDASAVIETKLRPPFIRHQVLSRNHLMQSLGASTSDGMLFSIVAPAGSGKTTMLVELFANLEKLGYFGTWLSLDEDDNEPVVFAKYLVASLYHIDPQAVEKDLSFIKANPSRDYDDFFDKLIARISRMPDKVAIFVDDFQHLSHPAILRFWNRLAMHAPPHFRLALASRSRLPLDLGRKRIAGRLLEIGHRELNFKPDEIAEFMRKVHSIELARESIDTLYATTEGWAAGLQLAGLAIGRNPEYANRLIQSFSGRNRDLTEYLFQAVLRVQPAEVQRFLLLTSPLTRFSPGLCNAVCQHSDGATLLDVVDRSNLFLIPLDQEGRWYRYHHLFAEFLQNELRRSEDFSYADVCQRASEWSETQGRLTEAVQYSLAGEQYDRAANLIAERAPDIAQYQGDHYTILDWMRRLPANFHDQRPELKLNHAWSRAFSRDLDQAIRLSEEVLTVLNSEDQCPWTLTTEEMNRFRWLAQVTQAIARVCSDQIIETLDQCLRIRNSIPESEPFLVAAILNATSYCYTARGELANSAAAALEAYSYGRRAGSMYAYVWADFLSTIAHVELCKLSTAADSAVRAMNHVGPQTRSNHYMHAMAALARAEVETQRCAFDQVEECLDAGNEFTAIFGPRKPLWTALRNEARMKAWKGDLHAARVTLEQGQDMALSTDQPLLYFDLVAEEIALQVRHGNDLREAELLLERSGLISSRRATVVSPDIRPTVTELARLSEARIKIAQGKGEEALRLLTLVAKATNTEQRPLLQLNIRCLRALACWLSGRCADAERELDKAISMAAPEQHAYPIVSSGNLVAEILESIGKRRVSGYVGEEQSLKHAFEQKLKQLLRGEIGSITPSASKRESEDLSLLEPLTDREIEILKLLSAGLTNQQLASELLISLSTVKWHLHNVYEKIGVGSRTAAAAYARELKLIS